MRLLLLMKTLEGMGQQVTDDTSWGSGLEAEEPAAKLTSAMMITYICISVALVLMAGLMSGLTIGLMALDDMEMEVLRRGGTDREKSMAKSVSPLLENHHFLLCTLVLWNAAAMEALPIFLDRLADPITAIVLSVTVVLIFGEIVPQSICTKYGLAVGYYSCYLLRLLMWIAAPVAWPLGKLLDYILGQDESALPRGQLQTYMALHGEEEGFTQLGQGLTRNELRVINSALELTYKTARQAMTPMERVFMISQGDTLDDALVQKLLDLGHSRIPVHAAGDTSKVVGLILVKEMLLKARDKVPVAELEMRSLPSLSATMPMYDILQLFKIGRAHMALLKEASPEVKRAARARLESDESEETRQLRETLGKAAAREVSDREEHNEPLLTGTGRSAEMETSEAQAFAAEAISDTYINVTEGDAIGIITIEDVIEELIGDEIVDETDRWYNNEQDTSVNGAELADTLPENLRTLLSLGVFTPKNIPGRPRRKKAHAEPSDAGEAAKPGKSISEGVGVQDVSRMVNGDGASTSNNGGETQQQQRQEQWQQQQSGQQSGQQGQQRQEGSGRSLGRKISQGVRAQRTQSGDTDEVSQARQRVQAHMDADPEVKKALDVLAKAQRTQSGDSGRGSNPSSFFQAKHARSRRPQRSTQG